MVFLLTCKNEADTNKIEGARVVITLYISVSDAQGQLTPLSVVKCGRNLHLFKIFGCSCNLQE